jgi:ribosomal protein S6
MQYELFYLVGERQEANIGVIKEGVNTLLVSHQATLVEPELSEKRKLSYEIKHQRKGIYITRRFELSGLDDVDETESETKKESTIEIITKKMNLNNDVLRFMIVKTKDLPELGSKEKRKAQEIGTQSAQRPQRAEKQPRYSAFQKPVAKPQPKPDQAQIAKPTEDVKDIDKQLDKLLDI